MLRAPFVCIGLDGQTYTRPEGVGEATGGQADAAEQPPVEDDAGQGQTAAKTRFNGEWAGNVTGTWWIDACRAPTTENVMLKLRQAKNGGPVFGSVVTEISTPGRRCGQNSEVYPSTQKSEFELEGITPSGNNAQLKLTESATVTLLADGSLRYDYSTPRGDRFGIEVSGTLRRR